MSNPRAANENSDTIPTEGAEALSVDANDQLVGTVFGGRYEILARVGQGGMSTVYKAKHLFMHHIVAVKVLLPNLVSQQKAIRRFQQEAKAAGSVKHPNAVAVHDFGLTESGQPFLVMDFLQGGSLADAIKAEGRLSVPRAIRIFTQACDALDAAHRMGIIHRDLKPSNIMLFDQSGQETVKIVDFGIAKVLSPDAEEIMKLTQTGEIFGSPPYMSPEQWAGNELDIRTDIYSMGCLMYETVTGSPPFVGHNMLEFMHKHVNQMPPRMTDLGCSRSVQDKLETVILKAIAKAPQDRQRSMEDLRVQIESVTRKTGLIGAVMTFVSLLSMRRRRIPTWTWALLLLLPVFMEIAVQVNTTVQKAARIADETKVMKWYVPPAPAPDTNLNQTKLRIMSEFADVSERAAAWDRGSPEDAYQALKAFGDFCLQYGLYERAARTFTRITLLKGFSDMPYDDKAPILEELGDTYLLRGMNAAAANAYAREIAVIKKEKHKHRMSFHAYKSLGRIYLAEGRLPTALQMFFDAAALYPARLAEFGDSDTESCEVFAHIGEIETRLGVTPHEAARYLFQARGYRMPVGPDDETRVIWTPRGYYFHGVGGPVTNIKPNRGLIAYWDSATGAERQNFALVNYYLGVAFSQMTDHDAQALVQSYSDQSQLLTARQFAINYLLQAARVFESDSNLNRYYLANIYDKLADLSSGFASFKYRWQAFSLRAFSQKEGEAAKS